QIDIGNAATDLALKAATTAPSSGNAASEPIMDLKHVADAVLYMANLPLEANVLFMTLKATEMPYEGRG
ncbi:MAG: 3-oxoacyl-ACP reductase, partial [Hyphomicrobium sp.]